MNPGVLVLCGMDVLINFFRYTVAHRAKTLFINCGVGRPVRSSSDCSEISNNEKRNSSIASSEWEAASNRMAQVAPEGGSGRGAREVCSSFASRNRDRERGSKNSAQRISPAPAGRVFNFPAKARLPFHQKKRRSATSRPEELE